MEQLPLLGISGICNLVAAVKAARYYGMDGRDVIFTVLTDSSELYSSRLAELNAEQGPYDRETAIAHRARWLEGVTPDYLRELTHRDRETLHNFKYFTWVEQQGRSADELRQLWDEDFWREVFSQEVVDEWDRLISAFNDASGMNKQYGD